MLMLLLVAQANMMLHQGGVLKLIDFGVSVVWKPGKLLRRRDGTVAYMAPEVLGRKGYTASVDIWAMGVALVVMLTGRLPFEHEQEEKMVELICKGCYDLPAHVSCP